MARPRKQPALTTDQIQILASIGCTDEEIALVAAISVDTLTRRFAGDLKKGRADLRVRLRRKQVDLALSGNVAMLIWLGKQYLGQAERQDVRVVDRGPVSVTTSPLSAAIAAVASDTPPNGHHS